MKQQITTLDNGLRIVTCQMVESGSVTVSIMVGTGGRYEEYEVNGGVSHILEHMLFKGTKKRPTARIISEQIDAVGGYNNAYTTNDVTNYYIKVPKEHAGLAIDILCDMLTNSLIDPAELEKERGVIIQEMKMRIEDDPAGLASTLIPGLIWPDNPMAGEVIGPASVIQNISREAVAGYWKSHYQPRNMVVAVAGNITHAEVVGLVTKLWSHLEGSSPEAFLPITKGLSPLVLASKDKDFAQAQIILAARAYPYRHASDAAAKIMTGILGRGMSSRLFENVREQKGLAYTVNASMQNFTDTGIFDVYAGVDPEQLGVAIEAILEELEIITKEPVTPAELNKAKNQTRGGLAMALESNAAVAERLGLQLMLLGSIESVEEQLARFDAVSVEDVLRVAGELLAPVKLRLGVVAPDTSEAQAKFKQLIGAK